MYLICKKEKIPVTQLTCKPLYPSLMHPTFPGFHHNFYPIYLSARTKHNKRKLNHDQRLIPTNRLDRLQKE